MVCENISLVSLPTASGTRLPLGDLLATLLGVGLGGFLALLGVCEMFFPYFWHGVIPVLFLTTSVNSHGVAYVYKPAYVIPIQQLILHVYKIHTTWMGIKGNSCGHL